MTTRQEIAEDIAEYLTGLGLNEVYGVSVDRITPEPGKKGKTFYHITFCKARVLDGGISVYGPTFIILKFNNNGYKSLPWQGTERFHNVDALKIFLLSHFGE